MGKPISRLGTLEPEEVPDWVLRWVPADWETGRNPYPGSFEGDGELALYRRLCSHRRWSDAGRAWRAEHRHLT